MAIPVAALLAGGQMAAGLAGTLMNKKKIKKIDYAAIEAEQARADKEMKDLLDQRRAKMSALLGDWQPKAAQSITDYKTEAQKIADEYEKNAFGASEAYGASLSDSLKRRTLGAVPEMQRNIREQLAASGGLRTGGGMRALIQPTIKAVGSIAEGQRDIELKKLQDRMNIYETLRTMNDDTLVNATGYTRADMETLLGYNREDINEDVKNLLDIAQNSSTNKVNRMIGSTQQEQAIEDAKYQRRADIISALSGGGGSGLGGMLSSMTTGGKTPSYAPDTRINSGLGPTKYKASFMEPKSLNATGWNTYKGGR